MVNALRYTSSGGRSVLLGRLTIKQSACGSIDRRRFACLFSSTGPAAARGAASTTGRTATGAAPEAAAGAAAAAGTAAPAERSAGAPGPAATSRTSAAGTATAAEPSAAGTTAAAGTASAAKKTAGAPGAAAASRTSAAAEPSAAGIAAATPPVPPAAVIPVSGRLLIRSTRRRRRNRRAVQFAAESAGLSAIVCFPDREKQHQKDHNDQTNQNGYNADFRIISGSLRARRVARAARTDGRLARIPGCRRRSNAVRPRAAKLPHERRIHLDGAGAVVLRGKIRLQIVIQNIGNHPACQRRFQSPALHGPIIVVADGQHDQQTVVLLRIADAPLIEQISRIVAHRTVSDEINRCDHDLRAIQSLQRPAVLDDQCLVLRVDDAREVVYEEGIRRRRQRRCRFSRARQPQGQRQ